MLTIIPTVLGRLKSQNVHGDFYADIAGDNRQVTIQTESAQVDIAYMEFTDDPKWFGFEVKAVRGLDRYPNAVAATVVQLDAIMTAEGLHCHTHHTVPSDPLHHRLEYRGMGDGVMYQLPIHVRVKPTA